MGLKQAATVRSPDEDVGFRRTLVGLKQVGVAEAEHPYIVSDGPLWG